MIIDHHREKLIDAIIYFVLNTKYCGKTKLFKLLYFLDFDRVNHRGARYQILSGQSLGGVR